MRSRAALVLGLLASAAASASLGRAGEPDPVWSRVRAAHFEVLTDAGGPLALRAAERLELLRLALRTAFPPREDGERHIVVLLLASDERFERLAPRRHRQRARLSGFFQGGSESDMLVARLLTGERGPYAALDHEYAHLVLNRSLPSQPLWVAEGLAELLSDGMVDEHEAAFGARLAEHEARLRESDAPLDDLLRLQPDSPEYLSGGERLYARCWALARWVVARRGLTPLWSYLEIVAAGGDATAAFEARLAPLAEVQATLLDVPGSPSLRVVPARDCLACARAAAPAVAIEAELPTRAEIEFRFGELLRQGGEPGRARAHFERALRDTPDFLPARLGLVDLRLRAGEWDEAGMALARVRATDPDEPAVALREARLLLGRALATGEPLTPDVEERLVGRLEAALARAPQLFEAALLLAELRPQPYARRVAALLPAFEQDPGRTELARVIAALLVRQRDLDAARSVLTRARDAARDPAYRFLCEHLLAQVDGEAATAIEVRGRLLELRCRADGSLRFTIAAAGELLWLEAASTQSFLVYREGGGASGESELVCGPQDLPLLVRYRPAVSGEGGAQGSVVWLELAAEASPAPPAQPPGGPATGNRITNSVPCPGLDATAIVPPQRCVTMK